MGLHLIAAMSPESLLAWALGGLWVIFKVAAGLGFVIFVHELGHFLAAKACGVKCEKFYIGFDIPIKIWKWQLPSSICKFQWGETLYGIGILPLGGYVKMLGQDDDPRNAAAENERIKVVEEGTAAEGFVPGQTVEAPNTVALDPRSFPAKSVPQRMVIISAGVIMNLISGVAIAAVAYRMGVPYEPCIIESTVAGDPAWTQNLQPGDQILQIGRRGEPSDHLRFFKDLTSNVMLNGSDHDLDLLIRHSSNEQWISLRPSARLKKIQTDRVTLGITPTQTLELVVPESGNSRSENDLSEILKTGDKVIAANGQPIEHHSQLLAMLAQHPSEPLNLTVLRKPPMDKSKPKPAKDVVPERVDVVVPPVRLKTLGLHVNHGPIVAVQNGSPAAKAGIQVGDTLVSVGGEPVGDALTFEQRLLPKVGQEVECVVLRGSDKNQTTEHIQVELRSPSVGRTGYSLTEWVGIETLGVAFGVFNKVVAVEPDSPGAKAGFQVGDEITRYQPKAAGPEQLKTEKKAFGKDFKDFDDPVNINGEQASWPYIHFVAQLLLPDSEIQLTFRRAGETNTAALKAVRSESYFRYDRGLYFMPLERIHTAASWSEAAWLGYREIKEQLIGVGVLLHRLVTGKISPKHLGGPILIAYAAGSEASRGIPRLLVFLAFLSANLAILNFLPIPALDGGHMMFLFWEGIFRRRVNERVQIGLTLAGIACLLCLMVFVFSLDIWRFFL